MPITVTHSKTLVAPSSGIEDKVYGADYVDAASHTLNGFGTGVADALGVNVGSAGAFVTFNGALGTPSSGTATNLSGTAASLTSGLATDTVSKTGTGSVYATQAVPSFSSTIGVGGATANASGAGVSFPGTQSASTDANTLDDYEEGTWTPADGSGAGLSFTSVQGSYVKVGRLVHVTWACTYPTTANTAQAIISGFPFAFESNSSTDGLESNVTGYTDYGTPPLWFYTTSGATTTRVAAAIATTGVNNNILSAKVIRASLTYRTAS